MPSRAEVGKVSEYSLALSEAEVQRYRFMAQMALHDERELWAAAGIVAGVVVADVGCGPGAVSSVLAEVVGPAGRVFGVDRDADAIAIARALARTSGVANATFQQGEADDTGLDDATLDAVMLRHVLAHNGGREQQIVDHLATLVRPGGCVYLVDVDLTAVRIHPPHPDLVDLTSRYVEFHARQGNDVTIGLRLGELLVTGGLDLLEHRGRYQIVPPRPGLRPPSWAARDAMVEAGVATASDVERWGAALDSVDRGETPVTLFIPQFCAVGRRPTSP